jgi:hypothetical protein
VWSQVVEHGYEPSGYFTQKRKKEKEKKEKESL